MRLVHAPALTVAALLLASVTAAQGLGDAAAKEKEKRKAAPAKPAKVYTEDTIGRSMAPVTSSELPANPDAATGQATGDKPAGEGAAAPDAEKAAEEARVKAEADWRKRLDQARKEEGVYKDIIDKLQLELNDTSGGFYNPGRASRIAFQDENRKKLAEVQDRIATLEAEGRKSGYR